MRRRRLVALSVVAGVCAGMFGPSATPVSAAVPTDHAMLAGNFAGGPRDELFFYAPGAPTEALVTIAKSGTTAPVFTTQGEFDVRGTYKPFVGNFDGDGFDEILFYAPGSGQDYIWNFNSYTSVSSRAFPVSGNYRPIPGDYNGDGIDDIVWYTPGSGPDYLWRFRANGTFTSGRLVINGVYRPVSGSFGNDRTDDIFWYSPGSAPDYLFDFTPGGATRNVRYAVNGGGYLPFSADIYGDGPGGEDIVFYAPGAAADGLWDYFAGELFRSTLPAIDGEYLTASGDFFGDGAEDLVFENNTTLELWDNTPIPGVPDVDVTIWVYTAAPAAAGERGAAGAGGATGLPTASPEKVGETTVSR